MQVSIWFRIFGGLLRLRVCEYRFTSLTVAVNTTGQGYGATLSVIILYQCSDLMR